MNGHLSIPGASAPPRLAFYHSLWALGQLPHPPERYFEQLTSQGFEGIEVGHIAANIETARHLNEAYGLRIIGQGKVQSFEEAKPCVEAAARLRVLVLNLHLGHAYMSAGQAAELANACHELATSSGVPLAIETHRGYVTQDLYRTSEWLRLTSKIRINLDVSHYIVIGEGFGGPDELFWQHLEPVLARTCMIHGRIGDGECVQSDVGTEGTAPIVGRFLDIWTRAMGAWRASAKAGEVFVFEPELGPPPYAQTDLSGNQTSDRWQQSLVLVKIARRAWDAAQERKLAGSGS